MWQKKWFNLDCSWKTDEYNFVISKHGGYADFDYIDNHFHLGCSKANDGVYFELHYIYEDSNTKLTEDDYIIKANTIFKNYILYTTFTEDKVADLLGKTLEFYQIYNNT